MFRCRCASFYPFISVPPFILVLSLFPLFFFCQARVQSLSGLVTGVSLMLWGVEFDHWLAVPSQKLLMLKMMLNKIRINILRLFNRLHGDVAQQNIFRGNALAQICFLPSNLYLVHNQTKVLPYLLKYLHSKCLVLCNIN